MKYLLILLISICVVVKTEQLSKPQTNEELFNRNANRQTYPISANDTDKQYRSALQYAKRDFQQKCQLLKDFKFEQILRSYKRESVGINYYLIANFSKGEKIVEASISVWQYPFHSKQGKYYYRVINCITVEDVSTQENGKLNYS